MDAMDLWTFSTMTGSVTSRSQFGSSLKSRGPNCIATLLVRMSRSKGAINCVESSTLAGVYFVVRSLTGAHIPNNAGCYRPISVTLPPGSIVNCELPCSRRRTRYHYEARRGCTVFGALAQVAPSHVPAASSGQVNIMYVGGIDEVERTSTMLDSLESLSREAWVPDRRRTESM